jgi:hypothetical protein
MHLRDCEISFVINWKATYMSESMFDKHYTYKLLCVSSIHAFKTCTNLHKYILAISICM